MKRVTASLQFDYNEETDEITNIKIISEGSEKKVTKTRTASKKIDESTLAMVNREDNKIVLHPKVIEMLGLQFEDRVNIVFEQQGEFRFPLLGKSENFGGKAGGNKLTKSNTIAYRGANNTILAEYGTKFDVEVFSDGILKLISLDTPPQVVETIQEAVKVLQVDIVTEEDTNYDLQDDLFDLNNI